MHSSRFRQRRRGFALAAAAVVIGSGCIDLTSPAAPAYYELASINGRPLPTWTAVLVTGDSLWMLANSKRFEGGLVVQSATFGVGTRNAIRDVLTTVDTTAYSRVLSRYMILPGAGSPWREPSPWVVRGDTLRQMGDPNPWVFLRKE